MQKFTLFILLSAFSMVAAAQTRPSSRESSFAVLPTFGSAPETGIQLGFNLLQFKDFAAGDSLSRLSRLFFWGFYTQKRQYEATGVWHIYTPHEKWYFNGNFQLGYWVDRYYRIGDVSNAQVVEYKAAGTEALDYANYAYQFTSINNIIDRKLGPHSFGGLVFDYDSANKSKLLADSINDLKGTVDLNRNNRRRVGLGLNLVYDSRDNYNNPLFGSYVQLVGTVYNKALGSDLNYHTITLDAIKYINTFRKQTLALRLVNEYRQTESGGEIAVRGLSYNGGISFLRGYYAGTFRANNLLAFETEYRLPINVVEGAGFFQFWKRIGMVFFASGVKVSDNYTNLFSSPTDFHVAAGAGLRYMLDMRQRINVSMDFAVGLDPNVGVGGARQSGLYFDISEAF